MASSKLGCLIFAVVFSLLFFAGIIFFIVIAAELPHKLSQMGNSYGTDGIVIKKPEGGNTMQLNGIVKADSNVLFRWDHPEGANTSHIYIFNVPSNIFPCVSGHQFDMVTGHQNYLTHSVHTNQKCKHKWWRMSSS